MDMSASELTRQAIIRSTKELASGKPFQKLSVMEISRACGINRNTFYYHFQDIPALMESIVKEDADRIIRSYETIESIEQCLNAIISFSLENRQAVLHIYRSINRDIFEQYQWRVCDYAVTRYIDHILRGRRVSESDRQVLISYVKCLSFGVVIGWLETGLEEDIQQFIHRICQLKQGDLERIIDECEQK